MVNCALCKALKNPRKDKFWNIPLFQTDHFWVLPSLGAMVDGWLLIVPKEHYLCMGEVPETLEAEFSELRHQVVDRLKAFYNKPVVSFEHGPSRILKRTGCGVDHAHVHFVPFAGDIVKLAQPYVGNRSGWYSATPERMREAYAAGLDYLYADSPGREAVMVTSREFSSQVFRRAIADSLQISNEYQWREFPRLGTVENTINDLLAEPGPISHGVVHAA